MPSRDRITVASTKFDGSLHYIYEAEVVRRDDSELWVYSRPGDMTESYRGRLASKSHALRIFWPDRDWNLHIRWRQDWSLEDHYVNIATPARWTADRCEWIDLDLDLILKPEYPEPLLDDADEFDLHSTKWAYGPDVIDRCWKAVHEVETLMKTRTGVFGPELVKWRLQVNVD